MGERKATNKYYPPDFDPKKHRSLDAYHGSHALRERARKLHEGILIIRFEMPYNIWCGGCGNHIGMGVRYNAEKSKVGMYYTTPIYKFRMKCHLCDNHFEIKTDPANHDYVIIEGARRKEQRWDPKENEQIVPEDKATQKKLATDAMYMLEHGVDDKAKVTAALPGIAQIEQLQTAWKDDYSLNKQLRNKFRAEKKAINDTKARDKALLQKSSLDIELVAEEEEDKHLAHLLNKYKTVSSFDERQKDKREEIANRPMFYDGCNNSPSVSSTRNKQELQHIQSKQQLVKQLAARKTSPFLSGDKTWTVGSLGIVKRRSSFGTKDSAVGKQGEDVPRTGEDTTRTDTADGTAKAVDTTMSVSVDGDSKLDHSDSCCVEKKDCHSRTVPVAADGGSVKDEMHDGTAGRHNSLNTLVSAYGSSSSNDSDST